MDERSRLLEGWGLSPALVRLAAGRGAKFDELRARSLITEQVLVSRGVRRATFANKPIQVANELDQIVKAVEVSS